MNKWLTYIGSVLAVCLCTVLLVPIPSQDMDYSKVVYDRDGYLLSASIADDGQWRFPIADTIPQALAECITTFEDEYFRYHFGVNPVSISKAMVANLKAKKIVRGGSTITMQVMRMYRGNRSRTISQKIIEILGAVKLELLRSKSSILHTWATIAPFGGNTVGAQTAAIRYFNRPLSKLSWSEYATLAVLPNSPTSIHLEKNRDILLRKRNFLLDKLYRKGTLDSISWILAKDEHLPKFNSQIRQNGLHFLEFLKIRYPDESIYNSTIDPYIQRAAQKVLDEYASVYQYDGIHNMAAIIIDNQANETLAYIGNVNNQNGNIQYVDCAQGLRSYGSLLKPFLYAFAIEQGYFLPHEIIKDIPTNINGYAPKNFDKRYRGVVPFNEMISYSLNIPAVRVLNYVGVESFHHHLRKQLELTSLHQDPHHHGLSLILGGAEASLWDMARLYKGLIRNHYELPAPYSEVNTCDFETKSLDAKPYHPNTVWHTLQAMKDVNRPREEQQFSRLSGDEIAWKTGTSFGHRDAWAIGCKERYTVAVWVGNQSGEGMHRLTGVTKAAPVLFRLFNLMPKIGLLREHYSPATVVDYCQESGQLKGRQCTHTKTMLIHNVSHQLRNCNHHQVNSETKDTTYVLDPVMSYYQNQFAGIKTPQSESKHKVIKIVYPDRRSIIQLPKKLDNDFAQLTAIANTNYADATLFWFLDGKYIQKTTDTHEIQLDIYSGEHTLLINDSHGNEHEIPFTAVKDL